MSNQGMQNNFIYFYDAANNTIKKETYDIEKLKSVNEFGKQIKLKINFNNGQNNIIFFAGGSYGIDINLVGNNNIIFIGNGVRNIAMQTFANSVVYIGNGTTSNGCYIRACEGKYVIIGDDCMFSSGILITTSDHHLIYDAVSKKRINIAKSVYIGDHVWLGRNVRINKGANIFSGSIVGACSVVTSKKIYSNSVYAGNPIKYIKNNIFWDRATMDIPNLDESFLKQHQEYQTNKYIFDEDKRFFLDYSVIEQTLENSKSIFDRFYFLFDKVFKNKEKNRFCLSNTFSNTSTLHYGTAKNRIHNHLSYKLGKAMIENSKSILGYIRMPYVLSYIKEQHNKEQKQYQEQIKKNPNLKLPKLESYKDYKEALKEKECFTYKLGEALMKADRTWYKGGYVKLWFEAKRLEREYREKRVERG
ncbi:hypothetical protein BA920_08225 [Helicobacter pullorum]|uniref:acyltransferase n=2 Tax=Helicobacter pullorum TaxID=35818 RepID=UPI0008168F5C|nr:acyltransferase [Helicobacter pullorum]OCR03408.1 hypothetical protein BA920_08225 [Helicobacter pullorum]